MTRGAIFAVFASAVAVAIGGSWLLGKVSAGEDVHPTAPTLIEEASGGGGGGKAADLAAQTDARSIGVEVSSYVVKYQEAPTVTAEDQEYVVTSSHGEDIRIGMSAGVDFGGWSATGADDWCLWVTAPNGDLKNYELSADGGNGPGNCT